MNIIRLLAKQKKNDNLIIDNNHSISYSSLYHWLINEIKRMKLLKVKIKSIGIYLPNSIEFIEALILSLSLHVQVVIFGYDNNLIELKKKIASTNIDTLIIMSYLYISNIEFTSYAKSSKINLIIFERKKFRFIEYKKNKFKSSKKNYLILTTSGTTNDCKNVILSTSKLVSNAIIHIRNVGLNISDSMVIIISMSTISCLTSQIFSSLIVGQKLIITNKFETASYYLDLLKRHGISALCLVPSKFKLLSQILISDTSEQIYLNKIWIGGDKVDFDLIHKFITYFPNCSVYNVYGLTELSPRVAMLNMNKYINKRNSVGRPIRGVRIGIYDNEYKKITKPYEIGKILIKSKYIMKGYYQNKLLTMNSFHKKMFITGDFGYVDNENFLYIIGREKNIIICGGENIYPEEIEEVIKKVDEVADAIVYGEKNIILGEIPVALVIKSNSIDMSDSEFKDKIFSYCEKNLSGNRVPFKIKIVDNIIRTESGKIKRRKQK